MRGELFNELRMAFEFFLVTRGAEVDCLSFQIYFCCFSSSTAPHTGSLNQ
jgi:hypothetical protein